ncbi:MAG: hypothetical protein KKC66_03395 [Candidatus Omnitrophica bacterium]|nr:hypothetical protein [Candidatus Omnitrophota bacterium]MBU1932927.1 hypothetical protein [Candidatus Omnitrophota bacterium]
MLNFKKLFSIKVISIIVAVSFLVTTNVYPDTLPPQHLRKQIDFNNKEEITPRYLCTMLAVAIHKGILDGHQGETYEEILGAVISKYRLPNLLEEIEKQNIQIEIDKEGNIWISHEPDNLYIAVYKDGQFGPKEREDFDSALASTTTKKKISLIPKVADLYFRPKSFERSGRVYEVLGIRLFQKVFRLSFGNLYKLLGVKEFINGNINESLKNLETGTRIWESIHIPFVVIYFYGFYIFFNRDMPLWAVGSIIANICMNIYPIMLQRYNRARIYKILAQRESKKETQAPIHQEPFNFSDSSLKKPTPDGFIRKGNLAFEQMVYNLSQGNFTDETDNLKEDVQEIEYKINNTLQVIVDSDQPLRIIATDAVVLNVKDDYSLGFSSHAPPLKAELIRLLGSEEAFNKLFPQPTLVLSREVLNNPISSIRQEYIYHEAICPVRGHYEAIREAQTVFSENYPDIQNNPQGNLQIVLRKVIDTLTAEVDKSERTSVIRGKPLSELTPIFFHRRNLVQRGKIQLGVLGDIYTKIEARKLKPNEIGIVLIEASNANEDIIKDKTDERFGDKVIILNLRNLKGDADAYFRNMIINPEYKSLLQGEGLKLQDARKYLDKA